MTVYSVIYKSRTRQKNPAGHGGNMTCRYNPPKYGWYDLRDEFKPKPGIEHYTFPNDYLPEILEQLENAIICGSYFERRLCILLADSKYCDVYVKLCQFTIPKRDFMCETTKFRIHRYHKVLPPPYLRVQSFVMDKGMPPRANGTCVVPLETTTYTAVCEIHKTLCDRHCVQTCKNHYHFKDGTTKRAMMCNLYEGRWIPRNFESCVADNRRIIEIPRTPILIPRQKRAGKPYLQGCIAPVETKSYLAFCFDGLYLHKRVCTQHCKRGYHLHDGNKTKSYTCYHYEGFWREGLWRECDPIRRECSLKLISEGSMKCLPGNYVDPPKCNVTCKKPNKNAELHATVTCYRKGSWKENLPFCIAAKEPLPMRKTIIEKPMVHPDCIRDPSM